MNCLLSKIKAYLKGVNKDTLIKACLFLIPLIGIILKGVFLQGFIRNDNPYSFDFSLGYSKSKDFISYYSCFALIFLSFSLLLKSKGRIIYLFIVDIFFTILTLLDVMYFRGFLTVPSVLIFNQTANLDNLGGTVISMMSPLDIIFVLDLILLLIYVFFTRKSYSKNPKRSTKTFLTLFIIPLLFIGYVPINLFVFKNEDVKNSYIFDGYDPTNTMQYFSPIGYHIIDLITVYRDSKPYSLTEEDKASSEEFYKWKNESLPQNEYSGILKDKNLIVIQVESLESFIIGKEYNNKKVTPVLDNLINEGIYFPNIYEQVNEGTSSDSDLMINTSILPLKRGSTFFRYPNANYNSMPKILEDIGYETASIHPDKGSFWNYANALKGGIAFQHFIDYYSFNVNEEIGMGISDKDYFEQVVPMLKDLKAPFYAHTITLTNHGPFTLPESLRTFSLEPELNLSEMGGYIESVNYTDTQIGLFLTLLDKEGILDNSVIAIVGDHTGVHKYYNHSIEQLSKKEDWFLYDGNPTVPFIIYDKSYNESKTFETIGGQIDVMPTLLYALGVDSDKYENTSIGRNLLNTEREYAILNDGFIKSKNLSSKDEEIIKTSLDISDKMIRANSFN